MATIERFIGPLGVGTKADIHALLDSQSNAAYPYYSATGGYGNGKSIEHHAASGYYSVFCSAAKTTVVGFWAYNTATAEYHDNVNRSLVRFIGPDIRIYNTSGGFDIRRGTTQIATDGNKVTSDLTHVEVKVFSDSSVGTVEIKLNGTSVYAGTGLNTGGQDITGITFCSCYNGSHYNSGIFIADDWVGALIPKLLVPTGDDSVQMTPSAGSDNYAMVDETGEDGDTTYVQSATVGHKDIYTFSDLDSGFEPKVISVIMVAKEADAGGTGMKILAVQDETEYTVKTVDPLPAAYPAAIATGQYVTLDACPDATALSRTKLNAMKFGVEVV